LFIGGKNTEELVLHEFGGKWDFFRLQGNRNVLFSVLQNSM